MKVTITYNLPEEQESLDLALNGHKHQRILEDIYSELRKVLKYGTTTHFEGLQVSDEHRDEVLEAVRDMINEVKQDYE